jgi:hypothetical protein
MKRNRMSEAERQSWWDQTSKIQQRAHVCTTATSTSTGTTSGSCDDDSLEDKKLPALFLPSKLPPPSVMKPLSPIQDLDILLYILSFLKRDQYRLIASYMTGVKQLLLKLYSDDKVNLINREFAQIDVKADPEDSRLQTRIYEYWYVEQSPCWWSVIPNPEYVSDSECVP